MHTKSERLKEAIDWLSVNKRLKDQKDLANKMGIAETSISRIMTGRVKQPSDNFLRKFNETFDGIFSMSYLRGVSDEMFNESPSIPLAPLNPSTPSEQDLPKQSYSKGKPYYNVDFRCGFDILMNCQTTNPDYLIDFQPYNDCDLYCNAHGDSMHPTISSGDIVALKRIEDFRYLINGEIYAIVTSNGMRTIKRIRDNGDTFTLIADNQSISDQTIPKSLVTHAFLVRGSIKMF